MNNCNHIRIVLLGTQEIKDGKSIELWNCVECKSTITPEKEDYFYFELNNKRVATKTEKG